MKLREAAVTERIWCRMAGRQPTDDREGCDDMIYQATIPVGARVRLRRAWDFLALATDEGTVLGPDEATGLVRIRLDRPAVCRFDEDEQHDVSEMAAAAEHLELIDE